ncbi:MAG: hypothetical protein ABI609_07790 [Acidobacteriota bacterium]
MRSRPFRSQQVWRKSLTCVIFGALLGIRASLAQTVTPAPAPFPVDRILAVVDDDPILASDVRQVIALGLVARQDGETDRQLWRRVLDLQIEQRLRFHDLDRFGFADVPPQAIERSFQDIRRGFPSEEAFLQRLREVGLTEAGLRQLAARQLMVFSYVEERLGARVFVSLEDITTYYHDVLTPQMKRQGDNLPPLDDVREQIRSVLREQRLLREIERWTADLRRHADVIDHFDSVHSVLPTIVYPLTLKERKRLT